MDTNLKAFIATQSTDDLYVLIRWPFVQDLMDYDWFREESILYQAFEDQEYLDSSYFVPVTRLHEIEQRANQQGEG